MIKNNRPYTDENGFIDKELLTDLNGFDIHIVSEWIKRNIKRSENVDYRHTSYGLKHILEEDTGIYLTNNQFKDAMLLAGYEPANSCDLNWNFRIVLKKEVVTIPNPFIKYLYVINESLNKAERHFFEDALMDRKFPVFADRGIILNHLIFKDADENCIRVFKKLWRDYKNA